MFGFFFSMFYCHILIKIINMRRVCAAALVFLDYKLCAGGRETLAPDLSSQCICVRDLRVFSFSCKMYAHIYGGGLCIYFYSSFL